jgi:hypothetical protein
MTYKALDAALNKGPAAAASLSCIQFAFSLFSGSSAAEDLLASGSSINWWSCSITSGSLVYCIITRVSNQSVSQGSAETPPSTD